jgi:peroxiredoxin
VDIVRLALLISLLFLSNAVADWYILFPKEVREKAKKEGKQSQVKKTQPIKVKRIACPDFTLKTSDLKEISLSDLNGKKVIVIFINGAFTPESESLLKRLDPVGSEEVVLIAVDVNESEFPLLNKLKRSLDLRSVNLTADAFLLKQVKKKVPLKGLPAIVFIDRYGYIRLFSDNLRGIDADSVRKQMESALKRIP